MTKKMTAQQIQKKYPGKYIDAYECPHWDTDEQGNKLYEVRRVFSEIHENTTKSEDLGTPQAFTR